MSVLIDGVVCGAQVSPVLLMEYLLEQLRWRRWQIVCASIPAADGSREIEALDSEGRIHNIEVRL